MLRANLVSFGWCLCAGLATVALRPTLARADEPRGAAAPDGPGDPVDPNAPADPTAPAGDAPAPEDPGPDPTTEDAPPAPAPPPKQGPYPQGKVRIGLGGGLFSSSDTFDFGFSATVGYFVFDNIELGVDGAFQMGDSPFAAQLGPTVRAFFPINAAAHPYVGAFYRHWFLTEGLDDVDSVGARAGIVVRTGVALFGIGLVYETIVSDCDGDGCSDLYPELGVSFIL